MRSLTRWSVWLLIATSLIHIASGLIGGATLLADVGRDGVFDAIGADDERQAWLWFTLFGWLALVVGLLARSLERRTGAVPAFLGWHLLAMAVLGIVLLPASGFWLVLVLALLILWSARRADAEGADGGDATERTRGRLGMSG